MKWYEIMRRKENNIRRSFFARYSSEWNTTQEINEIIKELNNRQDGYTYTIRIR